VIGVTQEGLSEVTFANKTGKRMIIILIVSVAGVWNLMATNGRWVTGTASQLAGVILADFIRLRPTRVPGFFQDPL
jgi:hypothetical protein